MNKWIRKSYQILKIIIGVIIFSYLLENYGVGHGIIGIIIYLLALVLYSIIIQWKYFKETYLLILNQTETVLFGKPINEHKKRSEIKMRRFEWKTKKKK